MPAMDCDPSSKAAQPRSFVRAMVWLAVLLSWVGVAGYFGYRAYLHRQANFGVVVPGKIFRSATISRHLIRQTLQDHKIAVIVFLSRDTGDDVDLSAERKVAGELGIEFLNFPMNGDGVAEPSQYPKALTAVYEAAQSDRPVLIHCHSGAQRTGGVVAMYRMLIEGKTSSQAYAELTHYGFDPTRNLNLLPFLNEHMNAWAKTLADEKVIAHPPDVLTKLTP